MPPTTLTDLPPELLDHITAYIPTAHSLTSLGAASKSLHAYVEKDAWQTFNRTRFPSLYPSNGHVPSQREAARTLTTLSKAWSRRAFVSRYVEPHGDIHSYPGGSKVDRWKKPRGQTIGFTPQLDVYEEVGQTWCDRSEVLAFSAGAEVCIRKRRRRGSSEEVRWSTYKPLSAYEGRDDVTTLHLIRPSGEAKGDDGQRLITGTANGDLRLIQLPDEAGGGEIPITYFVTNGQPVRSSSVLERPGEQSLLVSNMGDSRISIYSVDSTSSKVAASTSLDIEPPPATGPEPRPQARHQRVWSTNFLSSDRIVAGLGLSDDPIHVYTLTSSGLVKDSVRIFSLQNTASERLDAVATLPSKKIISSVYPIVALPPSNTASGSTLGTVFLSGAYDGVIRLHDLRSARDVETAYIDPTDDSAVYSLLPRGQETLVAGTSQHNLLKVFDLRLGAKCYDYLDAYTPTPSPPSNKPREAAKDWNLFLRPHNNSASNPSTNAGRGRGRGGGNQWATSSRRTHDSSVYSLASASPASPHIYAGVENAVLELAFTNTLDPHPDPAFFRHHGRNAGNNASWHAPSYNKNRSGAREMPGAGPDLDLAMYDQATEMKLYTQRSVGETWRQRGYGEGERGLGRLDERWKIGS